MELLFITLGGVILGLIARYSLPHRDTHGVVLVPAIGAGAAAIVWVALTWAGLAWDSGWIWVITIAVTAAIVGIADPLIGIYRGRADIASLVRLRSAAAR